MATFPDLSLTDQTVETLRSVLERHDVGFALVFGSAARPGATDPADIDIAVEFDEACPGDDGYSDIYLRLCSTLDETVSREVDVVDVHTMSPTFAHVAFDQGVLLVGSDARRDELADKLAGETPSVHEARERVNAAVERLQHES
jgi:predicted nucleotidyltransferase